LYHDERRALLSFLLIYVSSSILMLGSAGYFYYKERLATIDGMCGMTMENIAMQVEKQLIVSDDIADISQFFDEENLLKVGIFTKELNQALVLRK